VLAMGLAFFCRAPGSFRKPAHPAPIHEEPGLASRNLLLPPEKKAIKDVRTNNEDTPPNQAKSELMSFQPAVNWLRLP